MATTPTDSLSPALQRLTTLVEQVRPTSRAQPPAIPRDPGLPTDLLPPVVESWLRDTSLLAGVPSVMTTLPFLAATGGVIGNRLGLELHAGWVEYPSLWISLVALTGTGKTPALRAASKPFSLLHDEIIQADTEAHRRMSALMVSDVKWPGVERVLSANNGIILHCDELVRFFNVVGRYSSEARQRYLSLWANDHIFRTRQPTIHRPVLSIIGGIQPLMVNRIRHREPDGFMERFLLVVAGAKDEYWNTNLPAQPAVEPILDILRTLRTRETTNIVTFEPDALHLWADWYDAHNSLYEPDPARLVPFGFYRKYPTHLARITLILHALWHAEDPTVPVHSETVDRAITLIEYLRIQHHRSMAFVNERHAVMNPGDALTGRILDMLARNANPYGWVPRSRLANQLNDPPSVLVSSALDYLINLGHIETRTVKTTGRSAVEYRLVVPADPG